MARPFASSARLQTCVGTDRRLRRELAVSPPSSGDKSSARKPSANDVRTRQRAADASHHGVEYSPTGVAVAYRISGQFPQVRARAADPPRACLGCEESQSLAVRTDRQGRVQREAFARSAGVKSPKA